MRFITPLLCLVLALLFAGISVAGQPSDLIVDKVASHSTVLPGEQVTFTISITNDGESTYEGLRIHDALRGGLTWFANQPENCDINGNALGCDGIDLEPQATFSVQVWTTPATCGLITNQATVLEESGAGHNSPLATTDVLCPPLIQGSKTGQFIPGLVDDVVKFHIEVTNSGGLPSGTIRVEDALRNDLFWILGDYNFNDCKILPDSREEDILVCTDEGIEPRHATESGYAPGSRFVDVLATVRTCGPIDNSAVILHNGNLVTVARDIVTGPTCTTPTPAATSPPPTATATAPPVSTPTAFVTPKPPDTGTGHVDDSSTGSGIPWLFVSLGVIAFGASGVAVARRSKQHQSC